MSNCPICNGELIDNTPEMFPNDIGPWNMHQKHCPNCWAFVDFNHDNISFYKYVSNGVGVSVFPLNTNESDEDKESLYEEF